MDSAKPPIHGFFFNPPVEDHYIPNIMKEIFQQRVYDDFFVGHTDLVVLDVGANIGLFSYYAAPYSKKIYALEPSQRHFDTLSYMAKFNGFDNVEPHKLALAEKNGTATFHHSPNVTMYSLREEVQDPKGTSEDVETIDFATLLDNLNLDHIDFLKLDVEGSEFEIIASPAFRDNAHKIDVVMGEYHVWSNRNPYQLETMFRDLGFSFEWLPHTDAQVFVAVREK